MSQLNAAHVRKELMSRRAELMDRILRSSADASHRAALPGSDVAEQALPREDDDVLTATGSEAEQELQQVNTALERLHSGTYQQCARCLSAITPERLRALPYATTCVDCSGH